MLRIDFLAATVLICTAALGQQSAVITSVRAPRDAALAPDPTDSFWRDVPATPLEVDREGKPVASHRTELRSRWTASNLYLLYVCPFQQLYLKPDADTVNETNRLWNWDVAEAFLGSDFQNIKRYKEFEVSPRGEWVDLDIDRDHPLPEGGWRWNSGFKVATRIDRDRHIWYAEMQIPWQALDSRPAKAGLELRANFYRVEGPPPNRIAVMWQPTHDASFHVPESFGILRLVEK